MQISEVRHIFQDCCIKLKLLACCLLLKKNIYLPWWPPGYMVVTREPKFIFLCTLTCPKCRTWYYLKCNLFSKILEFVRTGEYSPMFPLPSANTIIIEKISVYKHWRHFRSRAQNHWCVCGGSSSFELVKSFTHRRISNAIFGGDTRVSFNL